MSAEAHANHNLSTFPVDVHAFFLSSLYFVDVHSRQPSAITACRAVRSLTPSEDLYDVEELARKELA